MLISFAGLPSDAEVRSASQTERSDQEGKTCKGLNQIFVIVVVIIAVLILVPLIKAANEMTRNLRIFLFAAGASSDSGRAARGDASRLWEGGEEEKSAQTSRADH